MMVHKLICLCVAFPRQCSVVQQPLRLVHAQVHLGLQSALLSACSNLNCLCGCRADDALHSACKSDADALCATVKHGGGRVQACLVSTCAVLSWLL